MRSHAWRVAPAEGTRVRRRTPHSIDGRARRLIRDLELGAELTGDEWPTAASVRGTADHLSRMPETSDDARVWRRAAELLEAREARS